MKSKPRHFDEFGQNRLLSRLNRSFSLLIPNLLKLPPSWSGEESGEFKTHLSVVNNLGLTLLSLGGVVAALLAMVLAVKTDQSALFFIGIGILPAVFLVQYILGLFCAANLNLSFGPPIQLVSRLLPEVITVFGFLAFVALAFTGLVATVDSFGESLQQGLLMLSGGLAATVLAGLCAWVAANSEKLLNLSVEPDQRQGPADYLFSVILYLGRYLLILVPYQFLLAMVLGTFGLLYLGVSMLLRDGSSVDPMEALFLLSVFGGNILQIIGALLSPIFAHFLYLVIVSLADIGTAFFRLVKGTERIAGLSEEAMSENFGDEGE